MFLNETERIKRLIEEGARPYRASVFCIGNT